MLDIIKKKRDGLELSENEIQELIDGLISGEIPDYQISAFLMALYFQGMNEEETAFLTDAVLKSGDQIDLSDIPGTIVDKHSTGGVGDKTTLILAPLIASAGVPIAKMSGRGLGHTGGTIDKLESIQGFRVDLTKEEFINKVRDHNIAICGQNDNLVPADKKLYALRDVTATVDNTALITSSIMSKKLACGADAIVIDMKIGEGAYTKDLKEAEYLAKLMISTGVKMGRKITVVVSAMDQPLGYMVGNALEVKEAIDTLNGKGPADLTELCLILGSHMLLLAEAAKDYDEAYTQLNTLLSNGKAFDKFKEFINSQGGNLNQIDNPDLLPSCNYVTAVSSPFSGYIHKLNALEIGIASVALGAGRENKGSQIDLGSGIELKKKIGDYVERGDTLAIIHTNAEDQIPKVLSQIQNAYHFKNEAVTTNPILIKTIH